MVRTFSYIIYKILRFLNILFFKITNRSFLIWFTEFIEKDSYKNLNILGKNIRFFAPNYITNRLVDEFFTKEPETIEWIDSFKEDEDKIIFWDIGANIGIYSIYAALKYQNIEVISFEPSTSNLRILSRNISINKLEDKIKINQNLKEELNRQIGRKGVFDEYPDLDFLEAVDYMIGELSKERKTKAKIATFFTIMFLPLFSYYFFNHTNVGITILFSFIFFMTFIIPLLTIISSWATNPSMKDLIHHDHTLGKRRKRYIASNFISVKSTIDYHEWERNTVVSDYLEDERKLKTKLKLIANPEPPKIKKIQAKLTGHRSFLERRKKELTARKSELEERNESLSSLNTELENLKAKMDSLWSGIKHLIPNSELV